MKLKRLLTAALSAVMALSVCALPAMAAGEKNYTFDQNRTTGSLTIKKYEKAEGATGNGDLLNGVEFTIYKLANIEQTVDADGKVALTYKSLTNKVTDKDFNDATVDANGRLDSNDLYNKIREKLAEADLSALKTRKQTTGEDGNTEGTVAFNDLELGVYMVAETKAPDQILTKSANFIVSIPMVDKDADNEYVWNYDVTAEPKNVPTYGGISLQKVGVTVGNEVETGLAGVLFRLEKKNGDVWQPVDASKFTFDSNAGGASTDLAKTLSDGFIVTGTNGMISIKSGMTKGTYRFVEIEAVDGYIANTAKDANQFEVDADANGELYAHKIGSAADKLNTIKVKNERPAFDKAVTKRDGTGNGANNSVDYAVGDQIPYTLTVKVPDTIANVKTFKVTDTVTPTQLKHLVNTVEVKLADGTVVDSKYYDIEDVEATGVMTIDFKSNKAGKEKLGDGFKGKTIVITYKAELLGTADKTDAGNLNKAELKYSNKTDIDMTEGTEGNPYTIHDEAVVYTFKTSIKKTDEKGTALPNVEFDLYKKYVAADGVITSNKVTFQKVACDVIDASAAYKLGLNNTAGDTDQWIKIKSIKTGSDGTVEVDGLPNGSYKLVETKTKDGYNLLKSPVDADLTIAYADAWETKDYYDKGGVLIKHEKSTSKKAFDTTTAYKPIQIVNRKGFNLPVTGGFGTLLFSGIGVLLVLAGVSVLFSLKKKNNRA